jgi:CBS domain containing-hemolysin-like protein
MNRYITTAQVGITIVSLGLGMYGEHVLAEWLVEILHFLGNLAEPVAQTISVALAVGILTYFHVVIGEMIPKSLALQSSVPTVLALDGPMIWMERIFRPLVVFLTKLGDAIVRLMGIPPLDATDRLYSPDELEFLVDESRVGGLIASSEQLFIENIFDLHERTVGKIMTPRTRVVGINVNAGQEIVWKRLCETRQTRYPIFQGNLDQIVGILHIKDLARFRLHKEGSFDLHDLVRPAVFIPESLTLEKTLFQFRNEQIQVAVVVDEYGGTAGLITLEDLVEEVVGEIQDEFDQEIQPIEVLDSHLLRVRGDLILDELIQLYNLNLDILEVDTVGGLVMTSLGRIPTPKDIVVYAGVTFEVETVKGLAVQTVLVHLPD